MTSEEKKYIKKNQRLPENIQMQFAMYGKDSSRRDVLIKKLVDANWTYEAVANASGLTRERVRQIANAVAALAAEFNFDLNIEIPEPPTHIEKGPAEYVEPDPDLLARLIELKPYAQQVRANGKKYREEGEEYTALIAKAHLEDGVPIYRIALRLGVTHGGLRSRLVRYGYLEAKTGKSKVYVPIKSENRVQKENN